MKNVVFMILFTLTVNSASTQTHSWLMKFGKYSCTASKFRNGSYEFIGRGSVILTKDQKYAYNGFEKPSTGTFTTDKAGNLHFKGGYLDGGKAEKTEKANKFLLVFPANPDNRWSFTLIE